MAGLDWSWLDRLEQYDGGRPRGALWTGMTAYMRVTIRPDGTLQWGEGDPRTDDEIKMDELTDRVERVMRNLHIPPVVPDAMLDELVWNHGAGALRAAAALHPGSVEAGEYLARADELDAWDTPDLSWAVVPDVAGVPDEAFLFYFTDPSAFQRYVARTTTQERLAWIKDHYAGSRERLRAGIPVSDPNQSRVVPGRIPQWHPDARLLQAWKTWDVTRTRAR
ncbi:MAG: hypothetical protein M1546_19945 [Chloroflexi bacterium]|nr:hypothetical protein [Chloroflexota bacterium]